MSTIIIFISSLTYVKNWIDPLHLFFRKKDINVIIFHMHSLRYEDKSIPESSIEYVSYDIGRLNIKKVIELLEKQRPDAVLFFHFKSFADYIVLRLTKLLNIRSIYLQHGIYSSKVFNFVTVSKVSGLKRYLFHFRQFVQFIFIKSVNIVSELNLVIRYFFNNNLKGTKYDHAILYSKYNLDYIQENFCFNEDQVKYSGFPAVQFQDQLTSTINLSKKEKRILFLQEKMIPAHTSISYDQEHKYFRTVINISVKYNFKITMRLHPRVDHEFYNKMLSDDEVNVDNHTSLYDQILSADIIIGNMSTALFAAVINKKPIITIFYPGFKPLTDIFDKIAIKAPNYNSLDNIFQSPDMWMEKLSIYDDFIDKYIGRNNSYENQANTILKLI